MTSRAMCPSDTCPARDECYRSPASGTEPSWNQTWSEFHHIHNTGRCDDFMQKWEKPEIEERMNGGTNDTA